MPGSKRNWRAVGFEMLVETKESGAEGKASKVEGKESTAGEGIEDASDASTRELSDALPRELIDTKTLGEDEIACGEWRATTGVTFLTTESLLDDAAYNEMWIDKFDKAREDEMMGVTLGGDVDAFDEGTALGVSQIQAHCFISKAGDCCPYIAIYSYCEGRITSADCPPVATVHYIQHNHDCFTETGDCLSIHRDIHGTWCHSGLTLFFTNREVNNGGGGIFSFVSDLQTKLDTTVFTKLFATPPDVSRRGLCDAHRVAHAHPSTPGKYFPPTTFRLCDCPIRD